MDLVARPSDTGSVPGVPRWGTTARAAPRLVRRSKNRVVEDRLVQAILLVTDLGSAREQMHALGLTAVEGGRHPGRGTANLIVPFGRQYLELLAVVDERQAASSPQGRAVVTAMSRRGPGLARWTVEPRDIEATARRVGHRVERRTRVLPDATTIHWRSVGVDAAWGEPWRCAFMAWDDLRQHPAHTPVSHPNGATGFARLDVEVTDRPALLAWLGGGVPTGVTISDGARPGPTGLRLASPTGEIPLT